MAKKKAVSNLEAFAQKELQEAGMFDDDSDYGGELGTGVMELIKLFALQGHSGASAGITIHLFSKLANYKPINALKNPLVTGEYQDCGYAGRNREYNVFQSTRISSVFSEDGGKTWYDIDKNPSWWERNVLRYKGKPVKFSDDK